MPAWVFPGVLGAVVLLLLFWAGCALFGGGNASPEETTDLPVTSETQEATSEASGVLAVTYDTARLEQARKEGIALRSLGYDVRLAQVPGTSGSMQFQLFVVSGPRGTALEPLLLEIQALSIEGQAKPFAGASIQPLPSAP